MFLVLAAASIPFSYDGALHAGQQLVIRDILGSVRVRTGDRLAIRATKHAERSDPNQVAIRVENRSDGIVVCVRYPADAGRGCADWTAHNVVNDNDTEVDFDVTVPRGIALDAASVNGSVDVVNDGPTVANTINGSVHADASDVSSANTVNGSVTVIVRDGRRGALSAHTINGSVYVTLPPGTGVALEAKTLTGSIHADGVTVNHPMYGPGASGHGTVGDGARVLSLETTNGSITLRR